MSEIYSTEKKQIAKKRFKFLLYEVGLSFLLMFILLYVQWQIFSIPQSVDLVVFGISFYAVRALIIFFTFLIFLWGFQKVKKNSDEETKISPLKGYLKLYSFTKKNFKYQILYGFLLFFLVLLPLDFLLYYFLPEIINYQATALVSGYFNYYLALNNYSMFLLSTLIVQFSNSFYQETIYRAFLAKRASDNFSLMSAVIISAIVYASRAFFFYFDPISVSFAPWLPVVWFIQSFFVGLVLAMTTLRRKWLFPAIFSTFLNNVLFSHLVWNLVQGRGISNVFMYVYIPLLVISLILFLIEHSRTQESFSIGLKMFKDYLKKEENYEKTTTDILFKIQIDIIICIIIFILSLFVLL